MVVTFDGRRTWIKNDTPSVREVLDVFPVLNESNRVSHMTRKIMTCIISGLLCNMVCLIYFYS